MEHRCVLPLWWKRLGHFCCNWKSKCLRIKANIHWAQGYPPPPSEPTCALFSAPVPVASRAMSLTFPEAFPNTATGFFTISAISVCITFLRCQICGAVAHISDNDKEVRGVEHSSDESSIELPISCASLVFCLLRFCCFPLFICLFTWACK